MKVSKDVDVLVIGAGISGIDAAYRLSERCPGSSWVILESRDRVGGTWDLFRYPGVRSDSDMFTLAFPFRPWRSDEAIVGGGAIRQYVEDTAREFGIFEKILFDHRATGASWSSSEGKWTVDTNHGRFTCNFLYLASGYYDYAQGHRPTWPGEADFGGQIIHPQSWPAGFQYAGKRIAVIGSGATAVTLVPALATDAAHVTLVQRTASYIVARPARDAFAGWLLRHLPVRLADLAVRWKSIIMTIFLYARARRQPERVANWIREQIRAALPVGYPVERDFSPPYKPWDQRLCLVPDGDLFAAIHSGKVSVASGAVERFIPSGLRLATGEEVSADIVVTATGLNVSLLGGVRLEVDGEPIDPGGLVVWNGMMLSGVPNLAIAFGYVNASWTLRSDLTARSFCRLWNFMRRKDFAVAVPRASPSVDRKPIIDLSSGYVRRSLCATPKQGDRHPWRVQQNYLADLAAMSLGPIYNELEFTRNDRGAHA